MRILLVQIRKDKMKEHEYDCFLNGFGLLKHELVSYDMFKENKIDLQILEDFDACIMGGSGEFAVYKKHELPFFDDLVNLVRYCYEKDVPLIGVCFGIQLAAVAFNGKVENDLAQKEAGSYETFQTEQAKNDPIFENIPACFQSVIGHIDSVTELPNNAINLAYSKKCAVQAFTFPNKRFYVFQFHPELTKQGLIDRLKFYYRKGYATEDEIDDIINNAEETNEVKVILQNFKKMI